MKESIRNTMKESLRNIRQIICRTTWLRSILVVLGVLISVRGWGQEFSTTLSASLSALNQAKTIATWTENNVVFTLTGGSLTLQSEGDKTFYVLEPNTTYTLRWAVAANFTDAYVFNSITAASASTQTKRTSTASPETYYNDDKVHIKYSSSNNASRTYENYSAFSNNDFELNNSLSISDQILLSTDKASQSHKVLMVNWTANFEYRLESISLTYSLFRKFHYQAVAFCVQEDGSGVSADYGETRVSFTNDFSQNNYNSSLPPSYGASEKSSISAESSTQVSATVQAYFKAIPNTSNGKVFVGWKQNLSDESYLSTSTEYSSQITVTSQNKLFPTQLVLYAVFGDKFERVIKYQDADEINATIEVDDVVSNAFNISECGTDNNLSNNSEDSFYYTIETSSISSERTGCASGHDQDVITYNPATNQLTAWNAGTATITFYQKETSEILSNGEEGASFTITVSKHTPDISWAERTYYFDKTIENVFSTVSGDATLYTYSSSDSDVAELTDSTIVTYNKRALTIVTIHTSENYKWESQDFTKDITPVKRSNHVPFIYNQFLYEDESFTSKTEGTTITPRDSYLNYLISGSKKTDHSLIIHFEGIPDTLSFQYQPKTETGAAQWEDSHFYVYESADGSNWTQSWYDKHNQSSYYKKDTILLKPTTQYLKFTYNGGENGGHFGNIHVTELHQFHVEPREIDFGMINADNHPQSLVRFTHANAGYTVQVTPASHFSIEPSTIPNTGGDRIGAEYIGITFHPTAGESQEYSEKIYIWDQLGNKDSVIVRGEATTSKVPEFSWNPSGKPYYCSPSEIPDSVYCIKNIFSSNVAGATIHFDSSNEDIAIIEDGNLKILTRDNEPLQEVTITVTQDPFEEYIALTQQYTFTPRIKVPLDVPFVVTKDVFEKAYDVHSELWEISGFFKTTLVNDKYKWDDASHIKLGGDDVTDWVGPIAITNPYLPAQSWADKYVIFEFDGSPDSISFYYRTNKSISTNADWYVAVSKDQTTWNKIWENQRSSSDWSGLVRLPLPHDIHYIKLCYSGNYAGYFKDVTVTAFDGYYFLKTPENLYLSRGGMDGSSLAVDEYGIAVRKTKSSSNNNTEIYTHLQHVDNFRYVCENGDNLITNVTDGNSFKEIGESAIVLSNVSGDKFFRVNADSIVTYTSNSTEATLWTLEKPEIHNKAMLDVRDKQVQTATSEFNEVVTSLDRIRERLYNEDYDRENVPISSPSVSEQYANNSYNKDVYSGVVDNLTPGLYRLNIKAFYRISQNDTAFKAHLEGYDCPVAYAYAEDVEGSLLVKTRLCSVYEYAQNSEHNTSGNVVWNDYTKLVDDTTAYYPNGMSSAEYSFGQRFCYDNDVYIYVHGNSVTNKGSLKYGIKSPSNSGYYNWLCYKDITLTRLYRKEFVFDNQAKDNDWNNGANWEYGGGHGEVPKSMHKVRIDEPVTITNANQGAYSIEYGANGNITIDANASLSVREGGFSDKYISENHITLKAENTNESTKGQTGILRMYPGIDAPRATVEFYSTISNDPNSANWDWQYIGSPVTQETVETNEHLFYNCWLYQHDTENDQWTTAGNWGHMKPFRGYAFTRNKGTANGGSRASTGPLFAYVGQLNAAQKEQIELKYFKEDEENVFGENHIANSWTAPIDLKQFIADDFVNVDPTINYYLRDGRGNAISVAPFTSEYTGDDVLPAMQGFFVKATGTDAKLVLDYERLVWKGEVENKPLKAPARGVRESDETDLLSRVCIHLLSADSIPDHIYLLEKEGQGFSRHYDAGYDAPKYIVNGLPCIYTYESDGRHLAVSATDSILGTYLAINTNSCQLYTIYFDKVIGEGLGLRDLVTDTILPIVNGGQYVFTAMPNSTNQLRFVVEEYVAPDNGNMGGTDITAAGDAKISIVQQDEIVYITGAARNSSVELYDAAGRSVLKKSFHYAATIDISALPAGIYVATVDKKATIKVLR